MGLLQDQKQAFDFRAPEKDYRIKEVECLIKIALQQWLSNPILPFCVPEKIKEQKDHVSIYKPKMEMARYREVDSSQRTEESKMPCRPNSQAQNIHVFFNPQKNNKKQFLDGSLI